MANQQVLDIITKAIELTDQCFGIECVRVLKLTFTQEKWSANRYVRTILFSTHLKSCCNLVINKLYQLCRISIHGLNTRDLTRMEFRVEAPHYCAVITSTEKSADLIALDVAHAIIELLVTSQLFPELRQTALQIKASIENDRHRYADQQKAT